MSLKCPVCKNNFFDEDGECEVIDVIAICSSCEEEFFYDTDFNGDYIVSVYKNQITL